MKRSVWVLATLLAFSLAATGSLSAQGKGGGKAPAPNAAAVWDYVKKADYVKTWKLWPGNTPLRKGPEPHGALITCYVNETALPAITGKKGKLPEGSVVILDNFGPDKKLQFIDVMVKVKGYNPKEGDWYWAQYTPDGKAEMEGKVDECIRCHLAQKSNDYVYTGKLK
jgi:hypothetical protein